jgi:hypothetical protein
MKENERCDEHQIPNPNSKWANEHKAHKLPLNTCTRAKENTKLILSTCERARAKATEWLNKSHMPQSHKTTYLDYSFSSIVPKSDVLY